MVNIDYSGWHDDSEFILAFYVRDWLWENPPVTHKDNCVEKRY